MSDALGVLVIRRILVPSVLLSRPLLDILKDLGLSSPEHACDHETYNGKGENQRQWQDDSRKVALLGTGWLPAGGEGVEIEGVQGGSGGGFGGSDGLICIILELIVDVVWECAL